MLAPSVSLFWSDQVTIRRCRNELAIGLFKISIAVRTFLQDCINATISKEIVLDSLSDREQRSSLRWSQSKFSHNVITLENTTNPIRISRITNC